MEETLITFETAKLAKEKGFGMVGDGIDLYYSSRLPLVKPFKQIINFNYKTTDFFKVCTQSLLQTWLRDKHKINCSVASNSLTVHFPMNSILEEDGAQMCGPKELVIFQTYEQALEHGLREALKLIP